LRVSKSGKSEQKSEQGQWFPALSLMFANARLPLGILSRRSHHRTVMKTLLTLAIFTIAATQSLFAQVTTLIIPSLGSGGPTRQTEHFRFSPERRLNY
jgi:hypothetical protein